jgi:hypothetical protein
MTWIMCTFILLAAALMIGVLRRTVTGLQVSCPVLCVVVTEDPGNLRSTGLWYHVLDHLGEHITIRVTIKRVQTQPNTQVLHATVGHNHTRTANVRPIGNMYHNRIFDNFTEGKTSKREEEMHSYFRAQLQMP